MAKKHSEQFVKLVDDALTRVDEISPKQVQQMLENDENFILYDVREQDEWQRSHIAGAEYMGKGVIERDIEKKVPDQNKSLVLYCGGGYRSALAADNLKKMGYSNVKSLQGGFRAWKNADLPVE